MGLLFRLLEPVFLAVLATTVALLGLWLAVRALRAHFGLGESPATARLARGEQLQAEARRVTDRIREAIRRERDQGGELARDFEESARLLLEERLPRIMENRRHLGEHLGRLDRAALAAERTACEARLATSVDAGLRAVLEKNLALAAERERNALRLETAYETTDAQLRQIVLALQDLEDKVLALRLAPGAPEHVTGALDALRRDVDLIEEQYRQLSTSYDA